MSGNAYRWTEPEAKHGVEPNPVPLGMLAGMLEAGIAEHRAGRLGEAERIYRRILVLEPGNSDALHWLGMVALQTGHGRAAIELMRRAIANCATANRATVNCCEDAGTWIDLGIALQTQGELPEAVRCYERALELKPESAAWSNRGLALHSLGRLEEAVASLERAIELNPEAAVMHANLGNVRQALGRLEEAEASQRRAIALQPANAEAYCNLGSVLDLMGRFLDSVEAYERALVLKPDLAAARWNRALHRLREGDFAQGLPEYEARWQLRKAREFTQPQWRGEPLEGARILLHAEQGLGDTVQFLRYVPMVQAAGGKVVLEVQPSLRRLAAELPGVEELAIAGERLPEYAWHCPLMSLPLAFGTTLESIPAETPYLRVPEEARERAARMRWPEGGLRVGLAWAGSPGHLKDRYRSIPLELLQPLLAVDGVEFFSLQVGSGSAEPAALAESRITDLAPEIGDMADTAALIDRLDLVICVDTAVAHLAGALGRPVWVLLPVSSDWRWLRDHEDSPWYPAMRLFRQRALNEWGTVIDDVRKALERVIQRDL